MDATLHEDKAELRILVLPVLVQVLPDGDCLLDEEVKVLWEVRGKTIGLEDAQDLAACDVTHEWDAETVAQGHADLRRGEALLCQFADVVADVLRLHLHPCRGLASVRDCRRRDTLAFAIHAPHAAADAGLLPSLPGFCAG